MHGTGLVTTEICGKWAENFALLRCWGRGEDLVLEFFCDAWDRYPL
jgi:hypothetical protein